MVCFVEMLMDYELGYMFIELDGIFKMFKKLEEIFGLSISRDGFMLIVIEDENGKIYFIDKEMGELEEDFMFWKLGDYEGVEVVGSDIYVLKSFGILYWVKNVGIKD